MGEPEHLHMTYNDIHNLIRAAADRIAEFKPDMLIAIGAHVLCINRPALTSHAVQVEGK